MEKTHGIHKLELRNLKLSDYEDIKEIMDLTYPGMGAWTSEQFTSMIKRFPGGQICIEDNGRVICAALSLVIDYSKYGDNHTYAR